MSQAVGWMFIACGDYRTCDVFTKRRTPTQTTPTGRRKPYPPQNVRCKGITTAPPVRHEQQTNTIHRGDRGIRTRPDSHDTARTCKEKNFPEKLLLLLLLPACTVFCPTLSTE